MSLVANLPEVEFFSTDPDPVLSRIISKYENDNGVTVDPASPDRLFFLTFVDEIVKIRAEANDALKQNLLAYSRGAILDHKGAQVNTPRLEASAALATQEFSLVAVRAVDTIITAGKRVSADGKVFWKTLSELTIPAGQLSGTVTIQCLVSGEEYNGLLPGQIAKFVDTIPFVTSTQNTSETSGGSSTEQDDPYRLRVHEAPESFSTAGPEGAYRFFAKQANSLVEDVYPVTPAQGSGIVDLYILLQDGQIPSAELLTQVEDHVSAAEKRPLTDQVIGKAPNIVYYDIGLQYTIHSNNSAIADSIQSAVITAVNEYKSWQRSELGRNINGSQLIELVKKAGAYRVITTGITDVALGKTEVAHNQNETITYTGLEE